MNKSKIYQFHNRYPHAEPIFLFVLGNISGIFINLFTGDISSEHGDNWRVVDSWYLWVFIALVVIGIVYYLKFSSIYSGKLYCGSKEAGIAIIDTVVCEMRKTISERPLSFEKKLSIAMRTTQTIQEIDTKLSGGNTYAE